MTSVYLELVADLLDFTVEEEEVRAALDALVAVVEEFVPLLPLLLIVLF